MLVLLFLINFLLLELLMFLEFSLLLFFLSFCLFFFLFLFGQSDIFFLPNLRASKMRRDRRGGGREERKFNNISFNFPFERRTKELD